VEELSRKPVQRPIFEADQLSAHTSLQARTNISDIKVNRRAVLASIVASASYLIEMGPRSTPASAITTRINDIRTVSEYFRALGSANRLNAVAIVDIAADWCDYCRVIDGRIMRAPRVLELLPDFAVLRVDVTEANDATRALLKMLKADGPPTIFIVDTKTGRELPSTRSVGTLEIEDLVARMRSARQFR
jgi:thiol:disulfide interchange protein DsbD